LKTEQQTGLIIRNT